VKRETEALNTGESAVELRRKEMIRIVEEVFRTMLQTEAEATSSKLWLGMNGITAVVRFKGAWQGTLAVECSTTEAKQLVQLFTGIENPGELENECKDVLGELANIVAGNLKMVLPKGTLAGLPEVVDGSLELASHASEAPIQIQTLVAAHSEPVSLMLAEKI